MTIPWRRLLRFNSVGALGIAVQLLALWTLVHTFAVPYVIATALAVTTAVVHNFIWHVRWTWADRTSSLPVAFGRFALTNGALSLAGNVIVMVALVGGLGMDETGANAAAITVCGLGNFWLSDRIVFPPASTAGTWQEAAPLL